MSNRGKTNYVTQQQLKTSRGGVGVGHVHANMDTLSRITPEVFDEWMDAYNARHSHDNKDALDLFRFVPEQNAVILGNADNHISFAAFGNVSAGGIGTGGGGGGGLASVWFNGVRADDGGVAKFGIKVNGVWATVQTDEENGKYVDITAATGTVKWGDIQEKPSWIGNTKPSYSQSEVINFLGYTPADNASLGNYLPLSGGTLTGDLYTQGDIYIPYNKTIMHHGSHWGRMLTGYDENWEHYAAITYHPEGYWNIGTSAGFVLIDDTYYLLHTGNFVAGTDYVSPSAISDMATKTWVGGNYLSLTGGNISGDLAVSGNVGIGTTSPTEKLHIVGNIIANRWYPKAADKSVYIEYDTTNNCFKVHGTIVATGNVIAGS